MTSAYEPISLGYSCEVKYQLARELYFRKFPDGSELDFRRMLFTPELGSKTFTRHIFDWQITPFEAVIAYLKADFLGVFEREDLVIDPATGQVVHKRLQTRHPHDFKAAEGALTEADVDRGYQAARDRFDYLAERFRRHLRKPGRYLYVFKQIRIYDDAVKLIELLQTGHRDHDFKLLFVDYDGLDQWLKALEDKVYRGWVPQTADKPADRVWEGDDGRWTSILQSFKFTIHGDDRIRRTFDEAEAAARGS